MRDRGIAPAAAIWALLITCCAVAPAAAQHKKQPPAARLDLNSATAQQLQELPGVGPTMAKAIVDFRQKSGRFHRAEDLLAIRGITKQRLEKMRPYVKISPPALAKPSGP